MSRRYIGTRHPCRARPRRSRLLHGRPEAAPEALTQHVAPRATACPRGDDASPDRPVASEGATAALLAREVAAARAARDVEEVLRRRARRPKNRPGATPATLNVRAHRTTRRGAIARARGKRRAKSSRLRVDVGVVQLSRLRRDARRGRSGTATARPRLAARERRRGTTTRRRDWRTMSNQTTSARSPRTRRMRRRAGARTNPPRVARETGHRTSVRAADPKRAATHTPTRPLRAPRPRARLRARGGLHAAARAAAARRRGLATHVEPSRRRLTRAPRRRRRPWSAELHLVLGARRGGRRGRRVAPVEGAARARRVPLSTSTTAAARGSASATPCPGSCASRAARARGVDGVGPSRKRRFSNASRRRGAPRAATGAVAAARARRRALTDGALAARRVRANVRHRPRPRQPGSAAPRRWRAFGAPATVSDGRVGRARSSRGEHDASAENVHVARVYAAAPTTLRVGVALPPTRAATSGVAR